MSCVRREREVVASEVTREAAQAMVAVREASVARWQQVQARYRGHLEAMALQVHPWSVTDSTPQSSHEVETRLTAEVAMLQTLLKTHGLPVKKTVLDKVGKQLRVSS